MPRTDPIQSVTTPLGSELPDGAAMLASIVDQLVVKENMRFATVAARTSAIATGARKAGMICFVDAIGYHECIRADGGAWVPLATVDKWLGTEPALIGAAPPAGTMKIRYDYSTVASTDANGDIAFGYGGTFPNGIVSLMMTLGDLGGATGIVLRLPVSTLSYAWARCHGGAAPIPGSIAIRVNTMVSGW